MSAAGFKPYKPRPAGSVHEALSLAFDQAGGLAAAGEAIGRDPKWLYAAADPDIERRRQASLSYEDARRLSRLPAVTALAEDLALVTGGAYLPPFDPTEGDLGELAALLGQDTGLALAELYKDLKNGRLSPSEARGELKRLREVMRAVTALYGAVFAISTPAQPEQRHVG